MTSFSPILDIEIPLTMKNVGELSVNKLYVNRKQGGRVLSTIGDAYKKFVLLGILRKTMLAPTPDPDAAYELEITFYLPSVYNEGWPKKAKRRFKKKDTSNLVKFFQDCVATATGVGDENHCDEHYRKRMDSLRPRVHILLRPGCLP